MARFITLAGRKQVGKDTAAQFIKRLLTQDNRTLEDRLTGKEGPGFEPHQVHIIHFADALKQACSAIFGIALEDMETETGKNKITDVRWPKDHSFEPHWENMGGRDLYKVSAYRPGNNQNAFMKIREILQFVGTELFRNQLDPDIWVKSVYRRKYLDDDIVIIPDCRFPNEAVFAKEHGVLIRIDRVSKTPTDNHASETSLDDFNDYHWRISNNGTFEDLRNQLFTILVQESFIV